MKLLSKNNSKLLKGEKLGWLTLGLSLAPFTMSGKNLCPHASVGCAAACLFSAGMGRFPNVKAGRIAKAQFFNTNQTAFLVQLEKEIAAGVKKAMKLGQKFAVRLNVLGCCMGAAWNSRKIPHGSILRLHEKSLPCLAICRWKNARKLPFDFLALRK